MEAVVIKRFKMYLWLDDRLYVGDKEEESVNPEVFYMKKWSE